MWCRAVIQLVRSVLISDIKIESTILISYPATLRNLSLLTLINTPFQVLWQKICSYV